MYKRQHHRLLEVPGEKELSGAGVSYCATCDGAFFRNKVTAVIGGGDVAVEDAIFLARMCSKVYVIHRRNELRAAKSLQEKLFSLDNVEMVWDSVAEEICGEGQVDSLKISNVKTGEDVYKRQAYRTGIQLAGDYRCGNGSGFYRSGASDPFCPANVPNR